ncbi:MAG: 2'-5' RNA ligase family protein [Candidatus Omnitrophota bacterium]
MSRHVAVDVALIPPDRIKKAAIAANRRLVRSGNTDIILNGHDCLPHITLAMGCVKKSGLAAVRELLADIAGRYGKMALTIKPQRSGKAWMPIINTPELQTLHETVMSGMLGFYFSGAAEGMFYSKKGRRIAAMTIDYVRSFPHQSAFGNFRPHITVASGDIGVAHPAYDFAASKLALCRLGNFCTCAKIMAVWPLGA